MIEYCTYTLATYVLMIAYSASLGWCIGEGVETAKLPITTSPEERVFIAKKQAAFFIGTTKYLLLLFPALLVACLSHSVQTPRDIIIIFIYCYASTALLQRIIRWSVKRVVKWSKDK